MTKKRKIEILKLLKKEIKEPISGGCLCGVLLNLFRKKQIIRQEKKEIQIFLSEYKWMTKFHIYHPFYFEVNLISPRIEFLNTLIKELGG